ncbi:MAG: DUF1643 domain-containing protein [Clostridiales bacterium]|nr:DUF1643 domain-containing protein [Clostridiales bacterium]
MHIPKFTTDKADVLSFAAAFTARAYNGYNQEQWLYVPDFYTEYRYILGTIGKNPLIAIGVNPSTAEPNHLDNTLKSVERIALANGYDSFMMLNVYAQRATAPEDMEQTCNEYLHGENLRALEYVLGLCANSPSIWAAWGTIIEMRTYLPKCVMDMILLGEKYGARWFTAGARSKKGGHPHHPLYLKKDAPLDPFDARSYCETLIHKHCISIK